MDKWAFVNSSAGSLHSHVILSVIKAGRKLGYRCDDEAREFEDLVRNACRPDVVLTLRNKKMFGKRKRKVFVECQWDVSENWKAQMEKQYAGKDYLVIPLQKLEFPETADLKGFFEDIDSQVEAYVDYGTSLWVPPKERLKSKEHCDWCDSPVVNLKKHLNVCSKKKKYSSKED